MRTSFSGAAPPLSTYSLCEQTWIDGRRFFDREEDRKLSDEVQHQRAVLIQKALAAKKEGGDGPKDQGGKPNDKNDQPYSCVKIEEGR